MSIYAVNGKEPIAAWIPSRDTAGNGTTTLTDLVGSNHGTLTNMELADWVSDTTAGGVRALDLDGVNEHIDCGTGVGNALGTTAVCSVSCWARIDSVSNEAIWAFTPFNSAAGVFEAVLISSRIESRVNGNTLGTYTLPSLPFSWAHFVMVKTASNVFLYVNNSLVLNPANTNTMAFAAKRFVIGGYYNSSFTMDGRVDDIRLFNQALDAADVSYLWSGGNGRGIVAASRVSMRGGFTSMNGGFCN